MNHPKDEKKYWSSLKQYNEDPAFLELSHKEFTTSPLKDDDKDDGGIARRDFMKLMAASSALATTACFSQPAQKILPYVNQPEEVTFGIPNYYASTCKDCSAGCGILVKTREGRPIKLEGNPDHPISQGALCAKGQASILNLYDPDRLRHPLAMSRGTSNSSQISWADVDKKIGGKLKEVKNGSGKIRILTEAMNSPSTTKLVTDFLAGFSHGEHVMYESLSSENVMMAQELSYGTRVLPRYRIDKADYIVSIDSDFLGTWLSPVEFTKHFTQKRRLTKKTDQMSKLVSFESVMSLTGANSDERYAIKSQDAAKIALALAYQIDPGTAGDKLSAFSPEKVSQETGVPVQALKSVAQELLKNKGKSLVIGGSLHSQSENGLALQIAINYLNSSLKNDGAVVDSSISPSKQSMAKTSDLQKLISDMGSGQVDVLFIHGVNPVYTLPQELGFAEASKKVALVVSFADRVDESASLNDFICPDNHYLESWGDAEPQKGLFSLVQPTIRPLYDTRSFEDSLLSFNKSGDLKIGKLSESPEWHDFLQGNWKSTLYKDFGTNISFLSFWESALRDGVLDLIEKKGQRNQNALPRPFKSSALITTLTGSAALDAFQLVFYESIAHGDGRHANNPWLQELPDPISRIVWDNYASLAPSTADKMHVKDGDMIRIKTDKQTFELPAHVQPGLHEKTVAIMVGYGRTAVGKVGTEIGKNVYPMTSVKNGHRVFSGFVTTVSKMGSKYTLASAQEHHTMHGRPIVREATLKEFNENPFAGNEEKEELTTLWPKFEYPGYRWGMSIDLNSCTGCNACVIACQAENNIPTVGKDAVNRGRIMHWIRIDRYYTGTPDSPQIVHQPMLCQHCENAPCETVCPVLATVHDAEGLNSQIYNRCVGTRYCSNNCPYKVRRFNWFEYNYRGLGNYPMTLQKNPEVTVRSRGVMEKCSFCIQRITDAKNTAKDLGRPVRDGELKTACQQSCPGDAIGFGNINDPKSTVRINAQSPRAYHVLDELNTRPSISYLTKIRNVEHV